MKHLTKIFDLVRALIYLALGSVLLLNHQIMSALLPIFKVILAITLLLYGTFRLYQVYIKHFTKQQDENN
jgi:hypothetical protein